MPAPTGSVFDARTDPGEQGTACPGPGQVPSSARARPAIGPGRMLVCLRCQAMTCSHSARRESIVAAASLAAARL